MAVGKTFADPSRWVSCVENGCQKILLALIHLFSIDKGFCFGLSSLLFVFQCILLYRNRGLLNDITCIGGSSCPHARTLLSFFLELLHCIHGIFLHCIHRILKEKLVLFMAKSRFESGSQVSQRVFTTQLNQHWMVSIHT